MLQNLLSMAAFNITQRKLRSFLTLLGIVIGVAAVVATVSIGTTMQENIMGQLNKFMADIISVVPGRMRIVAGPLQAGGKALKLTESDEKEIAKISGVKSVVGVIDASQTVTYKDETGKLSVYGIESARVWEEVEGGLIGLEKGRFISDSDKYSVVIGNSIAHDVFSEEIGLKKSLIINGIEFKVVGVMNKAGGVMQMMDSRIYIPIKTARELFGSQYDADELSGITAKISQGYDSGQVADAIEQALRERHKQTKDTQTFTVISAKFFQEQISAILSTLTVFLGALGGISLIVGGIGIMNIMYVSVTERTREIGIMKAIGANSRTVLLLFLIESAIFGLLGGIIGDMLGVGLGYGLSYSFQSFGPPRQAGEIGIIIDPDILVLGAVFGLVIGILAGFFPARKASKLQPVEALRYE